MPNQSIHQTDRIVDLWKAGRKQVGDGKQVGDVIDYVD